MAQPSIAAFFNTRKRAAADDVTSIKSKVSNYPILVKSNIFSTKIETDATM